MSVGVTGNQWYWNYDYASDKLAFNSESAAKEFYTCYLSPINYAVGETEARPNVMSNAFMFDNTGQSLDITEDKITHCDELILKISPREPFDSYMITEADFLEEVDEFNISIFDPLAKNAPEFKRHVVLSESRTSPRYKFSILAFEIPEEEYT
ncbi:MAG TPA: hypothetical protein VEA37_00600 [Flavobacterium sp.]|nr:hypothetical protein [Flavobacterium sp.]